MVADTDVVVVLIMNDGSLNDGLCGGDAVYICMNELG
jgi:hypothetical protein